MLVLSRKANEGLKIDHEVEFMVVSIDREKVRVGITAPKDALVSRSEHTGDAPPGFWVASSIMRELRPQILEAVAKGIPEKALYAAVRAAAERAITDMLTASAAG